MNRTCETIAAVATPPGEGAIGIVRMTGVDSVSIAASVFCGRLSPEEMESHTLHKGEIREPGTGALLDSVLLAVMRAPNSYTGEDMVEIYCHGGPVVLRQVLDLLCEAGAVPAERGEFSKRAFLSGRMDLRQAEAVLDLVKARTREAARSAALGVTRRADEFLGNLKQTIVRSLAAVEASIDFPEDDALLDRNALSADLESARESVSRLLEKGERGKVLRDGATAAIVGKPNVGKSSLLNALLGEERAIVAPLPGTTRDYLVEWADISGFPVKLIDTAGFRESECAVETEGVSRARMAIASSDFVLLMLDWSTGMTEEDDEVLRAVGDKPRIVLLNKCDLEKRIDAPIPEGWLPVSAKYGGGLDELKERMTSLVCSGGAPDADSVFARARHLAALRRARSHIEDGTQALVEGRPPEIVALELRDALSALGEIAGETTTEDVLSAVFSEFCIGK